MLLQTLICPQLTFNHKVTLHLKKKTRKVSNLNLHASSFIYKIFLCSINRQGRQTQIRDSLVWQAKFQNNDYLYRGVFRVALFV